MALLVATVYVVDEYRLNVKQPWPLWVQHYERVDPDFLRNAYSPPMAAPLQAMVLGTVPATIASALIAEVLFENGYLSWKVSSPFDFRLVGLHLGLGVLFWYAIGCGLEGGPKRWKKLAWGYVVARLVTVPLSWVFRSSDAIWWSLVALVVGTAWLILAVAVVLKGIRQLWVRYMSAAASAP